jgi:alpha-tubulin suppressor-like RCC1 family protein
VTVQQQFDQIACGSEHCMALTTDGELYSWGLNFKGQLGVSDFENRAQPVLIDSFYGSQINTGDKQS